jgi:hypothetical protein
MAVSYEDDDMTIYDEPRGGFRVFLKCNGEDARASSLFGAMIKGWLMRRFFSLGSDRRSPRRGRA